MGRPWRASIDGVTRRRRGGRVDPRSAVGLAVLHSRAQSSGECPGDKRTFLVGLTGGAVCVGGGPSDVPEELGLRDCDCCGAEAGWRDGVLDVTEEMLPMPPLADMPKPPAVPG